MFRSLLNIIPGERSFSPRPSFFYFIIAFCQVVVLLIWLFCIAFVWTFMTCQCLSSIMNMIIAQVSFGSDLSNRAPTFDMDLSDFMDDGKPISYEKARELFCLDPSQKYENKFYFSTKFQLLNIFAYLRFQLSYLRWAAYVAGTILVLMTELGAQFTDSISILVSPSFHYPANAYVKTCNHLISSLSSFR
jgi:hypothetical protein